MKVSVFWFRRDLRLEDNVGLHHALKSGLPIVPIFIFDENILSELPTDDPRVNFIYDEVQKINKELKAFKSALHVYHGKPIEIWKSILDQFDIAQVFLNKDYEPYAIKRDYKVEALLSANGIQLKAYKDQVIFEENEVLKDDGKPYTVFTPYMKKWKKGFSVQEHSPLINSNFNHFIPAKTPFPSKQELNIQESKIKVRDFDISDLKDYSETRNLPKYRNSDLSPHLRFGTVSVRQLFSKIGPEFDQFRNELIWREFFMQILFHFPHTVKENFRSKYDLVEWRNNEEEFEQWCKGETGYPLVDAGMRELNETGYMHGRVRMVTASFLVKHLLIDWRWGEAYFAQKLLDFELSSNVGNWQWVAGTGTDAAPYFRIFNPTEQLKRFDPKMEYVRKLVPEVDELSYAQPIVDHKFARERCLKAYKVGVAAAE